MNHICCNLMFPYMTVGPRQRVGYSDSLRAGRFGVRTLLGAKFYAPVQTGVWVDSLLCNGTGPISGDQRPGRTNDYLPSLTPKKEKLELCTYSPSMPLMACLGVISHVIAVTFMSEVGNDEY